jgi:hypothetical protein
MNSELGDLRSASEDSDLDNIDDNDMADTVVLDEAEPTDNIGDASVEINVEELIADIEKSADDASCRKMEVRRRLEEIAENKSFDDTFAIEFDE